jgi:colicin import membrane protein
MSKIYSDSYNEIATPEQSEDLKNFINSQTGGNSHIEEEIKILEEEQQTRQQLEMTGGKSKTVKKSSKKSAKPSKKSSKKKSSKKSSKQMSRPKKASKSAGKKTSKKTSKKSSKKASKKASKKDSKDVSKKTGKVSSKKSSKKSSKTQKRGNNPSFDAMVALRKHIGNKLGNHSVVVSKVVSAYANKVKQDGKDKVQIYAEAKKIFDQDTPANWKKVLEQAERDMKEKKANKK